MNFLDLLIAIPLGYLIFKGYRRGLIFDVASLAGIILGVILAVHLSIGVSSLLPLHGDNALLISFFLIFVAVVVLSLFLAKLVERFIKLVHAGFFNNFAGAVFGLIKGTCILGVLLYYIAIIDLEERVLTRDSKESSLLYHPVERTGNILAGKISSYLDERRMTHEEQEAAIHDKTN